MSLIEVRIWYRDTVNSINIDYHMCDEEGFGHNELMDTYEVHKLGEDGMPLLIAYWRGNVIKYTVRILADTEGERTDRVVAKVNEQRAE